MHQIEKKKGLLIEIIKNRYEHVTKYSLIEIIRACRAHSCGSSHVGVSRKWAFDWEGPTWRGMTLHETHAAG